MTTCQLSGRLQSCEDDVKDSSVVDKKAYGRHVSSFGELPLNVGFRSEGTCVVFPDRDIALPYAMNLLNSSNKYRIRPFARPGEFSLQDFLHISFLSERLAHSLRRGGETHRFAIDIFVYFLIYLAYSPHPRCTATKR